MPNRIYFIFLRICNTINSDSIVIKNYIYIVILIRLYSTVKKIMLAKNIRKLRIKKGLSQEKLARMADISTVTLVKIESGVAKEPTITTVIKIASALGISIDELVCRSIKNKQKAFPNPL